MPPRSTSRREFLQATVVAGTLAGVPDLHTAGSDLLRVGLVGCGDRGTGAATQALAADPHIRLVAMADAFEDRLQQSLAHLKQDEKVGSKVDVAPDHRFVGFDACQKLLESGVDVVLLCTPPHFRPLHLQAAVQAGKHVFAEKPVAVDARELQAGKDEMPVHRLGSLPAIGPRIPRNRQQAPRGRGR